MDYECKSCNALLFKHECKNLCCTPSKIPFKKLPSLPKYLDDLLSNDDPLSIDF